MKCEDIEQALNDDRSDLQAIARHLETCPKCAGLYRDDLRLEMSLREISPDIPPLDITGGIGDNIVSQYKQLEKLHLLKRWVWLTSGGIALAILSLSMTTIAGWLTAAYSYGLNHFTHYKPKILTDAIALANKFSITEYYTLLIAVIGALAVTTGYYIWREYKELIGR